MDGPSAAHEAALVRCSTVQWLKYAFVPLPLWCVALIFVTLLSVNVFDLVLWFKMLQLQVDSYVTQPYTAQMQFCRKKSQLTSSCPCTKASQCKAAKPSTMRYNEPSHNQPTAERHSSSRRAWATKQQVLHVHDIIQVWYVGRRSFTSSTKPGSSISSRAQSSNAWLTWDVQETRW